MSPLRKFIIKDSTAISLVLFIIVMFAAPQFSGIALFLFFMGGLLIYTIKDVFRISKKDKK